MEAKEEAKEEASYLVFFSLSLRQTLLLFICLQCTRRNMFSFRASIESLYKSLLVSNSLSPPPTPLHALPFETYTCKTHKRYIRERKREERERVRERLQHKFFLQTSLSLIRYLENRCLCARPITGFSRDMSIIVRRCAGPRGGWRYQEHQHHLKKSQRAAAWPGAPLGRAHTCPPEYQPPEMALTYTHTHQRVCERRGKCTSANEGKRKRV